MMRNGTGGLTGIHRLNFPASLTTVSPRRSVKFPMICLAELNQHYVVLGLTHFASKSEVKFAYKRLALKYHPDVIKGKNLPERSQIFQGIKSAYESLMRKFEEEEELARNQESEMMMYDEWEEWMGFEGGIPFSCHSF